ncbi:MAG: hypothetical protein QOG06_1333 [Gaiellaceae bacterium]|nr:hypothetical protein [Gaiellaceae bacterium]
MSYVRLHRLLGQEEADADLAIHQAVGDQLEDFDLTGRRLLFELLERAGERNDLGAAAATLGHRIEAATVVDIAGQDLLALGSIHGNGPIGHAWSSL